MENNYKLNINKILLDVVVTQEKIKDKTYFVAQGIQIDVASQGLSLEEALENIKDAAKIVIDSNKEEKIEIMMEEQELPAPILTRVFI